MRIEELFEDKEDEEHVLKSLLFNLDDLSDKQGIVNRILTNSRIYLSDPILSAIMMLLKKLYPMHYAWFFDKIRPKIKTMRPLHKDIPRPAGALTEAASLKRVLCYEPTGMNDDDKYFYVDSKITFNSLRSYCVKVEEIIDDSAHKTPKFDVPFTDINHELDPIEIQAAIRLLKPKTLTGVRLQKLPNLKKYRYGDDRVEGDYHSAMSEFDFDGHDLDSVLRDYQENDPDIYLKAFIGRNPRNVQRVLMVLHQFTDPERSSKFFDFVGSRFPMHKAWLEKNFPA